MGSTSGEEGSSSSSSRPSIQFSLGLVLLILTLLGISGLFCCCYHWNKIRAIIHQVDSTQSPDSAAHHPPPQTSMISDDGQSVTVMMPGDQLPKFLALPAPSVAAYMDAIDEDLFETILNGPYESTMQRSEWTGTEKKAVQLDKIAKSILFMSLEDELFEKVVNCKTSKEIWEALLIMHEETEDIREVERSWSDSENDSSSESREDEETQTTNICLMAKKANTKEKEISIDEAHLRGSLHEKKKSKPAGKESNKVKKQKKGK